APNPSSVVPADGAHAAAVLGAAVRAVEGAAVAVGGASFVAVAGARRVQAAAGGVAHVGRAAAGAHGNGSRRAALVVHAAIDARLLDGHAPIAGTGRHLQAVEAQTNGAAEGLRVLAEVHGLISTGAGDGRDVEPGG